MAAVFQSNETLDSCSYYETAFLNHVFAVRGIAGKPTAEQFAEALRVLQQYAAKINASDASYPAVRLPGSRDMTQVARFDAHAFLRFATVNPTSEQEAQINRELYGPRVCEACD
ncbi:MAG: hypothetical protein ABI859_18095 [Pseudomonadota bacterium]